MMPQELIIEDKNKSSSKEIQLTKEEEQRIEYIEKMSTRQKVSDEMKENLIILLDMGMKDFDVNFKALQDCKNNLEMALIKIMELSGVN